MNAYGCIATGLEQGMIEVVRHAETLANIQKNSVNKSAFDKRALFEWLEKKNRDPNE